MDNTLYTPLFNPNGILALPLTSVILVYEAPLIPIVTDLFAKGLNEADGPAFKMKNDPRITKFGKFLRKTSIDELPQIWDIFVGRISIVGPRSPLPDEVKEYSEYQLHRLDVKGGLLCLWQIEHNRNQLSFDEWIELDLKYIQKRSIWLDLKIIFKGAWMVLFDRSGE